MGEPLNPGYTKYHPRWHRRRVPIFWWLGKPSYTWFIARELTSLSVAYAAIVLLLQIWSLTRGPEAYDEFSSWLRNGLVVAWHSVVLLALLLHSTTWFSLAPKALALRFAGRRLPGILVLLMHYAAWLVASGFVAWLLLGG
ncbi:MAG: fumarate reductase subunit C [Gemmatimonadota bacterium]